jgi:hypothetical protein
MKKSFKNFIFITLMVGIVGTLLLALAEHIFGAANVFAFCFFVVLFAGVIVVPMMQIAARRRTP